MTNQSNWISPGGNPNARIALVGEAPGGDELKTRSPFVGRAGMELYRMLTPAFQLTPIGSYVRPSVMDDLWRTSPFYLTNVFLERPLNNEILRFFRPKENATEGYPMYRPGRYIAPEKTPELDRLASELNDLNPDLIVALGATAVWALLRHSGLEKVRGTIARGRLTPHKVLSTYHPAAVIRRWPLRATVIRHFFKAERQSHYPEIRRPNRTIYTDPTLEELETYLSEWKLLDPDGSPLSIDIETARGQITCIGYAPDASRALVVPFVDPRRPDNSYWPDLSSEKSAWHMIDQIQRGPRPKVFQNGQYDMYWLWRRMGIPTYNAQHDTMILHHAIQPELPKGLDFLASIYCDEVAWKLMRPTAKGEKMED